jgi:ubiquinone/menaquinone biosynthesis C-methylase UbiE
MGEESAKDVVLKANITMHTALANTYDAEQPHYRSENKAAVSAVLDRLARAAGNQILVDFGCGTGFIISLAESYFQSIYGVDVTPAMMSMVDLTSGKVKLLQANTESVPLEAGAANVVTANSFLHHLYDIQPTIREAYRLLKPGGVFYSEEDPNLFFWESLKQLAASRETNAGRYSYVVERELAAVTETQTVIEAAKGVDANVVQLAEYQKMVRGGMQAEALKNTFRDTGFSEVKIEYYWFLGQASLMQRSPSAAREADAYLKLVLPLSRHLYKYFRIEAWK